jgi:hypothetical protein
MISIYTCDSLCASADGSGRRRRIFGWLFSFDVLYVKYEMLFLPFQPLQGGKKEFGNLKRYVNILFSSYMCDCAYSPDTQEEFFAKKKKNICYLSSSKL